METITSTNKSGSDDIYNFYVLYVQFVVFLIYFNACDNEHKSLIGR